MAAKWKRNRTVAVYPGLRIHTAPKVASTSILGAAPNTRRPAYPEEWGEEYRFMVVRHPLDRLVSAWAFFIKDTRRNELLSVGYERGCDFEEFLCYCFDVHDANQHTRGQWLYAGPWEINHMARYEAFPREWDVLRKKFKYLFELPVKNKSEHEPWASYYTARMRADAEKMFAADMALYEMAKG